MPGAPPCAFVIFGATGDLSARKLLPALYTLHRQGQLDERSAIIGYGRSGLSTAQFRSDVEEALREHAAGFEEPCWARLAPRLHYVQGGYGEAEGMRRLAACADELGLELRILYTATPPSTYLSLVQALREAGLEAEQDRLRLVIEKPFGHDLASARELNRAVARLLDESQVYRIDHYLAKETAQNLAVLRFANTLFEPVWTNRYLDHVQITMAESLGVEDRGSFYEQAGVIRDVFQNHLLQLLALIAMEPPARYDATSVRNEKVKVLDALACLSPEQAVLGQYVASAGAAGYRQEPGVAADSRQATYAAARFEIRNWRWSGVPFYVRSGKRLETKATEIVLQFKVPPHNPFDLEERLRSDRLILRLAPDEGITLRFNAKEPGQRIDIGRVDLDFSYRQRFRRENPDAYETLLLDVMEGDATLFMRADEVEAQWRVVEPLLDLQESRGAEPLPYEAGSMGPEAAYRMLEESGRSWHRPSSGPAEGPGRE